MVFLWPWWRQLITGDSLIFLPSAQGKIGVMYVSVERIGITVSVLEQTELQNWYLRRGRYKTLQAGHLEERLCYSQYRYTKAKVHVFYREQRVGDLEYSPHCLQVDPAIHTPITIDNLSVSDQLLIWKTQNSAALVDGAVLDALRSLYNKPCWWMCNNLAEQEWVSPQ